MISLLLWTWNLMLVNMVVICMFNGVYHIQLEYHGNSLFIKSYMIHVACMECVFSHPNCVKLKNVRTKCYCTDLW